MEAARIQLQEGEGRVSTSPVGRFARMTGVMARTGSALAVDRVRRMVGANGDASSAARRLTAQQLASSLGEMKGLAMKIGQMMSYVDRSVPPEYRKVLALLQTQSQPTPPARVRSILAEELAQPPAEVFSDFSDVPIACASIGQVHRARLRDGDVDVAVKVQHPEVEAAIRADLKSASVIGRMKALALPGQDIAGLGRELEERFLEECDYRLEAERQAWFGDVFRADDVILVPEVHGRWCTKRVLVTTFQGGTGFDAFVATAPSQAQRDRYGDALFRFYLGTLYEKGVFNADPHPGNYLVADDGSLVMLDYGCVRRFEPEWLEHLKALLRAVLGEAGDAELRAACEAVGIVHPKRFDAGRIREFLRYLYAPALHQGPFRITHEYASQAIARIGNPRNARDMRMPRELLFLTRVNIGLMSIFAELGAELDWRARTLELL